MGGFGIAALLAFVSLILSYGLLVPSDLRSFSLIAAAASMAGFALGSQSSKNLAGAMRAVLVISLSTLCVICIVTYVIFIQRGSGETSDVIMLAVLLFGIFFSLTFLMPLAGISID